MNNIVPLHNKLTWQEHVDRINGSWAKGVESVVETGRRLIEAKSELDHGEWLMALRDKISFGEDTAQRLMKIAGNPTLSNAAHARYLPASWRTLYELSKLPEDVVIAKIGDGTITPKLERKDVMKMIEPTTTAEPEATITSTLDSVTPVEIRGMRIMAPDGLKISELTSQGIELEKAGDSREVAARKIGLASHTYTFVRDIVLLSRRTDLNKTDADIVAKALQEVDETRQLHRVRDGIVPIARRVWGAKGGRLKQADERRTKQFESAITFVLHTCETAIDIIIPQISDAQAEIALKRLSDAEGSLRKLRERIRERQYD